jgi:hypothetical protein
MDQYIFGICDVQELEREMLVDPDINPSPASWVAIPSPVAEGQEKWSKDAQSQDSHGQETTSSAPVTQIRTFAFLTRLMKGSSKFGIHGN